MYSLTELSGRVIKELNEATCSFTTCLCPLSHESGNHICRPPPRTICYSQQSSKETAMEDKDRRRGKRVIQRNVNEHRPSGGLPILIQHLKLNTKLIQPLYLRCTLALLVA